MANSKVRRHRIVIRNLTPTNELVASIAQEELGDDIMIKGWWEENSTHFTGMVPGGAGYMSAPQRDTTIIVEYTEDEGRR